MYVKRIPKLWVNMIMKCIVKNVVMINNVSV